MLTLPGLMLFGKPSFSFSQANPQEPHFFVLLRASGGMDATLGLDPLVMPADATQSDIFIEYRPEDIVAAEGLKFGPAAKSLAKYANQSAVVNGIMMKRDAGHETGLQYMSTGRGDGSVAILPVELAVTYGSGPYGVIFNRFIYAANRIIPSCSHEDILNEAKTVPLADLLKPLEPKKDQVSHLANALRGIINSKAITNKLIKAIADVKKEHADAPTHVQAILAAFISGASQQAVLDIDDQNLDTHSDHVKVHLEAQTAVWQQVSDIFSRFEKTKFHNGNLMDYTTFLVITEFSRTPFLNGAKGKDHNTDTNSVLIAGKGVKGGQTVGASKVIPAKKSVTGTGLHIATAYDPKTGLPATGPNGATFIYPENVIRTVAEIFGNPPGFSSVASNVSVIKGILKG